MSPTRLRECLALLRWSQRGLAEALNRDPRQVQRWAAGEYAIPDNIAGWLESLAAFHAENPPPMRKAA